MKRLSLLLFGCCLIAGLFTAGCDMGKESIPEKAAETKSVPVEPAQ